MDGTIYSGQTLFDFTPAALDTLDRLGIGYTFLTNNSSRSVRDYLKKIHHLGLKAHEHQLYTSSLATIEYLQTNLPDLTRLYILGTASLQAEFQAHGFHIIQPDDPDEPQAVIVGFDTDLRYAPLCRAAYWIKAGKPYLATHPDRICPTDQPTVLVDCGAVCACLEQATGRPPDVVLGKPDPCMITGILRRHQLQPHQLAMVGDRLYTDMAMARRAGALGVLVLTGESTAQDVAQSDSPPDLVAPNLMHFVQSLTRARSQPPAGPAAP